MNAESGTPRLTDAEFLAQLLKDKKIFKSGTYPNNDKIKQLAFQLGAYRSFIEHRKAVISREKERHRRIRDALDVLIELQRNGRISRSVLMRISTIFLGISRGMQPIVSSKRSYPT
jgi:hypothetical protein